MFWKGRQYRTRKIRETKSKLAFYRYKQKTVLLLEKCGVSTESPRQLQDAERKRLPVNVQEHGDGCRRRHETILGFPERFLLTLLGPKR